VGRQRLRGGLLGPPERVRDQAWLDQLGAVEKARDLREMAERVEMGVLAAGVGRTVRIAVDAVVDGETAAGSEVRQKPLDDPVCLVRIRAGRAEDAEQDQADGLVEVEGSGRLRQDVPRLADVGLEVRRGALGLAGQNR
jgi:hypothetical protein